MRIFAGAVVAFLASTLQCTPAFPQAMLGQAQCRGSYAGTEIAGAVLADLWQATGPSGADTQATFALLYEYLMRGELQKIPGTVRLFGDLRDAVGNLVNFEVFLLGSAEGTGSVWINGARHRETYMRLVLGDQGFAIFPETGGVARFACERVG